MSTPHSAVETLEREFFEIRAELLRVAASFDRMDRGAGEVASDPRMQKLLAALELLASPDANRAEALQMLFSLDYDDAWRAKFDLKNQSS